MLVRDWMSKNVVSVGEDESMQRATAIMKEHKIRMLPVIKNGKLVGVVSDTDLKRASASDATTLDVHELLYLLSKIKVKDIMAKDPVTVPVDWTVEETAEVLLKNKISGVPVVDAKGQVIELSGLGKRGVQFAFKTEDHPGTIKDLTDIIRNHGGRIASILGSYERMPAGYRMVYIRAYDVDRGTLPQLQKELQQKASLYYVVDHRENRREIFRDAP
jgi:acetoin utilization protein AcuB